MEISPRRWERVKELYAAALECSPAQRESFLQQNEHDELVCHEVRRLLAEHEQLGSFLSTPPFARQDGAGRQAEKRFAAGEVVVQRFRIISFLAAGGMGEVYKAEDTRLARIVALKFLPKNPAEDRDSLERFRLEAKSASALNHPNICTIYDFGEDADSSFMAMEYLEGETLSCRIQRGALAVDEALRVAIAVANALAAAHGKGIIHRDLKPGNIMLTDGGTKLLDFGLAIYARPNGDAEATATILTGDDRVAGTLPYMSPERLHGEGSDARGDIFAFGAVLYEMLTGKRAFQRPSNIETIAALDREDPKPIREFVEGVPNELEQILRRCLRKRPEERYASMAEVQRELEECRAALFEPASGFSLKLLLRRSKQLRVAVPAVLVLVALVSLLAWGIYRGSRATWARNQALPQIAELLEHEKFGEAYALAMRAERYIPQDAMLAKLWPQISWSEDIVTNPPGASVFRKNYNAADDAWEFVGRTPIQKRRFPLVNSKWKFERKGFGTVERATFPDGALNVTLDEQGKAPDGMVRVELSASASESKPVRLAGLPGFDTLAPVPLNNYWMDKFEVTNAEFKQFVDQAGYQKPEYWKHEFRKEGQPLRWADAMKLFQDRTGRPGPANWSQGEYPAGQESYPVTGVSWFEAAAYAEFAGKSLPTIYHWLAAAKTWNSASILPASNFSGAGLAARGTYHGMSWSGVFDMAGNAKEWIANEASSGKHFILGGAWNEPTYTFFDADARSPFDRSANFGFRCAKYVLSGESLRAASPITMQVPDYNSRKPVSDQVFAAYKSLFFYDRTPLHAMAQPIQQTDNWREERITFDAAYGREQMVAYLFLPKKAAPPFQTVVYFTGAAALHERSSANLDGYVDGFDFIVKSGRAVIFPIFKGTFERWDDFKVGAKNTSAYRDHVIMWSKDLGRSLDYLETRSEIDHTKFAYEGISWGAAMGAILPAVDDRFKALLLVSPGFYLQERLPEVDQINFVPRVKAPALMLNGRFDFLFPVDSSQEPMFRLLGASKDDKRRVLYDVAHDIPRDEMIKESLNWLDRYLGSVK